MSTATTDVTDTKNILFRQKLQQEGKREAKEKSQEWLLQSFLGDTQTQ